MPEEEMFKATLLMGKHDDEVDILFLDDLQYNFCGFSLPDNLAYAHALRSFRVDCLIDILLASFELCAIVFFKRRQIPALKSKGIMYDMNNIERCSIFLGQRDSVMHGFSA